LRGPSATASTEHHTSEGGIVKKPIRCMLGKHHNVWRANPDGGRYQQCSRCGRDDYRGGSQSGAGITGGFLAGSGGAGF